MKKVKVVALMFLFAGFANASVIQFGGNSAQIPLAAGLVDVDIIVSQAGLWTNFTTHASGDLGPSISESTPFGDDTVTEGLKMTVVANSTVPAAAGDLKVYTTLLGIDNGRLNEVGESLTFTFNDKVKLYGFSTFGASRKFDLTVNGTTTSYNSNTTLADLGGVILDAGAEITLSANALSDVAMQGITVGTIPEPATLGLIAFFGTGILFIRRKLSM